MADAGVERKKSITNSTDRYSRSEAPSTMPSGIAMAAAITVDKTVRSTVFTKSKPSRPPAKPLYIA
jgi:hypothetical protein